MVRTCMDIDHAILTRFNLPTLGAESVIRAKDGWLRARIALFEKYCVPSVLAQSTQNFSWIIYFDPESPGWLKDRIETFRAKGDFEPIFRASVSNAELVHDLRRVTGARGGTLITSNLDNDDSLAVNFIERLQSAERSAPREAMYIAQGLIKSPTGLYRRTDRHNAFCSVREGWDDPKTCWVDWHDLLSRHFPARELSGAPGWLQVVHGTNVSNRIHGSLTGAASYRQLFPDLLDDVPTPQRSDILRDRLLTAPARAVADAFCLGGKRLLRASLGKDGLDRVKFTLASIVGGRG